MKLLYSNILPLGTEENQETVTERFMEEASSADAVEIAVGYVSKAALQELEQIVDESKIQHIVLTIGMYYVEGMPEGIYHTAIALNRKWVDAGIGEIRIVRAFKYHGKLYAFYKEEQVKSAIIGSANLGVIKLEANNRRQYEVSAATEDSAECNEIATLIRKMATPAASVRIDNVVGMPIIRELNTSLTGVDAVDQIPQTQVELFERHKTATEFRLPLKVPPYDQRFSTERKYCTRSNLNVCYAKPRKPTKPRDWYETQLTVNGNIKNVPGYPEKNVPFFVVTDDGYTFKAHTTSDGNKQFSAVGDELILGRWIKGRLAAAGLVTPVNDTQADTDRTGMITKEMLATYGCDRLVLTKTDQKTEDEEGNMLDVWLLSFEATSDAGEGDEE